MKVKVTEKQVKENYKNIIYIGYCELSYLLKYQDPNWYTKGNYGWKADIYEVNPTTVIVTGYQPFGNYKPPLEFVHSFDNSARDIIYDKDLSTDEINDKLKTLLNKFIEQTIKYF